MTNLLCLRARELHSRINLSRLKVTFKVMLSRNVAHRALDDQLVQPAPKQEGRVIGNKPRW